MLSCVSEFVIAEPLNLRHVRLLFSFEMES